MAKKQTATKKAPDRKRAKKPAASAAVTTMSTAELQAEINRRQAGASKLIRKRDRLREQLAKVEAEIAEADPALSLPPVDLGLQLGGAHRRHGRRCGR
ncbi:MAG: hypothetical protein AAFY46_06260, partial [Planctomycetota bacterium]